MDNIRIISPDYLGKNFIPSEYLPHNEDEYYQRNKQAKPSSTGWRRLNSEQIKELVNNGNISDNWDNILVKDQFETSLVRNNRFFGLVRIGNITNVVLEHHDLKLPAGITNSVVVSCDIGDDVAMHNVRYLGHYIIGDRCILFNVDEMHTSDHAKFGNGLLKEGEPESMRTWIDIINETGSRRILPFEGIISADAYLWSKYKDDHKLQKNLIKITQNSQDSRRGYYGTTGNQCVIKNSRIIKDVKIGPHCYIRGVNKLKNLTINSSEEEPSNIGEGVELVNGIIGYGCHVSFGSKAVEFVMGNNSNLKYGARLIHSFLGDNSTIACCEVLNNLIFPGHEQHHNNSFLIASVIMGQSNIAAGATIGSNHNIRANDNEIQAGRGFWPGLCTSLKHSSRFASFVIISKADYPAELNIQLPFSLINNNISKDQLEILPAFWWLYNMYAFARNAWKFQNRDKRINKSQHIEFDPLAPDTVEEIISALRLMEIWTAKASLKQNGNSLTKENNDELAALGHQLFANNENYINNLKVLGENIENAKRDCVILKPYKGYKAYKDMLHYYAVKNLIIYMTDHPKANFKSMYEELNGIREHEWVNLGGQIMLKSDLDKLRSDIGTGKLSSWKDIHGRYDQIWEKYTIDKQKHAFAVLSETSGKEKLTVEDWNKALTIFLEIQKYVSEQVYVTRKKDYENQFRKATYRNEEEMIAAIGTIEDNSFINMVRKQTADYITIVEDIKNRENNPMSFI